MLVVKTSRVSNVKCLFCLTVALVALVGLGILPAYNWISSAAGGGGVIARTATPAFGN
jgi:hypothetical protein